MGEADEKEGASSLAVLVELQDEDSAADQLRHRRANLPGRGALAEARRDLARLDAAAAEADAERRAQEQRLAELSATASEVAERAARIDERLRSDAAGSFRDQEAMATEMDALGRRRRELDDEQLAVMEAIEPLEATLGRLADERRAVEAEAAGDADELAAAESSIDAELAESTTRRQSIVARLPDGLLTEYERLRSRLEGVAVARLVGGTCTGCHLALPATELERIRAGGREVFHCDQCGRIIVAS